MRVWVDLTNSPHVLVFRPIIAAMRADGHEVQITARDFAQTLGLLERFKMDYEHVGRHRGPALAAKGIGLVSRSFALAAWARSRDFDLAIGHGSNDVTVAARMLRIPCATMFDYEYAKVQHHINCRLAATVVVPETIPADRLRRYRADGKIATYPGLKEEYYLADFEPDSAVLDELGLNPSRPIAVVRTAPADSLYHRFENGIWNAVLARLSDVQTVVLPRTDKQRARLSSDFIVPETAIDAPSLIAYADVMVSAGGTMNREAVALGTPAWTTFEGRPGAVDDQLVDEGRLQRLRRAEDIPLGKRPPGSRSERIRRDPRALAQLLMRAAQ